MINKKNKFGQEEMVGFALIIIIVAVIFIVFLGFALNSQGEETIQNYEVESFIQAFLQYTTDCRDNFEYLSIEKLISDCDNQETCLDGRNTCDVLNFTLRNLIEESWRVGQDIPVKSYELIIDLEGEEIFSIQKGNSTGEFKGAKQEFSAAGNLIEIFFTVYS